jgi:hypothetical protein
MTDLTDKMRTCAAFILATDADGAPWADVRRVTRDAVDLLLEASNVIEAIPEPLGAPMDILTPKPPTIAPIPDRTLGGNNDEGYRAPPPRSGPPSVRPNRVCPQCDSRANKRVFRDGAQLYLSCPVCAATWNYRP